MSQDKDPFADLRALLVQPRSEPIGDKQVVIAVIGLEKIVVIADLLKSVKDLLVFNEEGFDFDLVRLLAERRDIAIDMLVQMTDEPAEWLAKLRTDQAMFLLAACIRTNADFFIQRLAPLAMQAISSLAMSVSGLPGPSPPTSEPLGSSPSSPS
ncbi:hypothetical protein [Hydrocarboniphaga effusa]|uniref:hypothetical protein n=1 Tax=Hydrocarboniphaga effusa TaxID=243629 RepID=UPI003BA8C469